MKRFIIPTILTLILVVAIAAFAQDPQPAAGTAAVSRTIAVTGTVETQIAPDIIVWNIMLRDLNKDFAAVKTVSDEKMKKVVALREKLKIPEADFQTGPLSVERVYEPRPGTSSAQGDERGEFKGYSMRRSITVTQRDLKQFDKYFDTLLGSTDMEVSYFYDASKKYDVRKETRLKALAAAREKAAAMAEALGAKLGRVMTINENSGDRGMGMANFTSNNSYDARPPLAVDTATERFVPGSMTERVSVNATFELE